MRNPAFVPRLVDQAEPLVAPPPGQWLVAFIEPSVATLSEYDRDMMNPIRSSMQDHRSAGPVVTGTVLVLTLLAAWSPAARSDGYRRDTNIDVLQYIFQLTLSDHSDVVHGQAEVVARFLADGIERVSLDLVGRDDAADTGMTVTSVTRDGEPVQFEHEQHKLGVHLATPSRAGERRTFKIRYEGAPADGLIISTNKYDERTFFGDNWPNRARHWLPSVDHPSDKAICEFIVIAPGHYQVVAVGTLVEETNLEEGLRRTHWRSTVPLPTKVMVIGAARFAVEYLGEVDGTPLQSWVYPQDRDAGFYDFSLADKILRFFNGRVGPFPYSKLANVQSKTRWGGMENASAIFYSEKAVTGTRENEGLLAHEIAHQWFGDSVTEADWHHVWLSEGFATYFTQLYLEHTYGRDRFIDGMKDARARYLSHNPHTPIVDTSIDDLMKLLGVNSYQKGAWVLHMLRKQIGDEAFWRGIQIYYGEYRDGNTLTADLREVMERVSEQDLRWFFDQWVHRPEHPRYEGSWHYDDSSKELEIRLQQIHPVDSIFRVTIEIGIQTEDGIEVRAVEIDEASESFTLELENPPSDVTLDPNTWLLMEAEFSKR